MLDIKMVEYDLLEMKAGTLYKYGKKLELAEEMYQQKTAVKERTEKILARLKTEEVIKKGWHRKKRQQKLIERVEGKLKRLEKTVAKLAELKDKYIKEFKYQREACGLTDHCFVDKFYCE